MSSLKRRCQKDTAKELLQGYFEGLIRQNKKLKEKARLNSKNGDRDTVLLKDI